MNKTQVTIFIMLLLVAGGGVFCFLSWKEDPDLGATNWMPKWIAIWGDKDINGAKRTGVPMIILGFVSAMFLWMQKWTKWKHWMITFACLILFVVVVESIQLFLPTRTADIQDILWAGLGTGLGMGIWRISSSLVFKNPI